MITAVTPKMPQWELILLRLNNYNNFNFNLLTLLESVGILCSTKTVLLANCAECRAIEDFCQHSGELSGLSETSNFLTIWVDQMFKKESTRLRSLLFWVVMLRMLAVTSGVSGDAISHIFNDQVVPNVGNNYHHMLCNNPEERGPHLHHDGILRPRKNLHH
jgi:hypothetical protein